MILNAAERKDLYEMSDLTKVDLNGVVGFATILTAMTGMGEVVSAPLADENSTKIGFFCFFIILRFKMFLDDEGHEFKKDRILDSILAIVSWILFLFSASTISVNLEMSMIWFMSGIAVSTVWALGSLKQNGSNKNKYKFYICFNIVYILLLFTINPSLYRFGVSFGKLTFVAFVLPIIVTAIDWFVSDRFRQQG